MSKIDVDVCVVGGGAAGLAAAECLGAAGLTAAVLEAKGHLGGRIVTDFSGGHPDLPLELGAEFVHGKHPDLYDYGRKHGLALDEVEGRMYRDSGDGLRPVKEEEGLGEGLSSPEMGATDQPFSRYLEDLNESVPAKNWLKSYVEGFNAADANRIGTKSLLRQQQSEDRIEGDRAWRFRSGYQRLVETLASRLAEPVTVLLGHVVKSIEWRRGAVRLNAQTQDGTTVQASARAAVITLPIGVLQNEDQEAAVSFDPVVPLLEQINLLVMGAAIRLNFIFRERVWEDAAPGAGFILSREQHFPTWWPRESKSGYVLTAWSGGPKAFGLPVQSKDRMADLAIAALSRLLRRQDRELRSKVESIHYHDWHSDPFSLGSYSYVAAGGFDFSQQFPEPVEQTLWFAGEAAARDGYWGTVHGALQSGRRAAEQIAEKIDEDKRSEPM